MDEKTFHWEQNKPKMRPMDGKSFHWEHFLSNNRAWGYPKIAVTKFLCSQATGAAEEAFPEG
jgi:hypothetical protein